ncbi:MAG: hypothetical protein P4L98_17775 [Ancalomicrobiaceae bacterium]|nr:hypothetical protein [Ancalomicrobiaceae bacterium]
MRIFLSYRPELIPELVASRFRSHLMAAYSGADVFSPAGLAGSPGERASRIISIVAGCDALVALISPGWLECRGDRGRFLDDPLDPVKAALMVAMNRQIPLLPVLIDHAAMPHRHQLPSSLYGLAQLQPAEIRDTHFGADFDVVLHRLGGVAPVALVSHGDQRPVHVSAVQRSRPSATMLAAAATGVIVAAVAAWALLGR